jgi:hypothetical protein
MPTTRRRSSRWFDEHIVAYRLDGPLFFGVAHSAATPAGNDGCNRHDV